MYICVQHSAYIIHVVIVVVSVVTHCSDCERLRDLTIEKS